MKKLLGIVVLCLLLCGNASLEVNEEAYTRDGQYPVSYEDPLFTKYTEEKRL